MTASAVRPPAGTRWGATCELVSPVTWPYRQHWRWENGTWTRGESRRTPEQMAAADWTFSHVVEGSPDE